MKILDFRRGFQTQIHQNECHLVKINFFQEKYLQFIRYNNLKRFRGLQMVFEDMTLVLPCPNSMLVESAHALRRAKHRDKQK